MLLCNYELKSYLSFKYNCIAIKQKDLIIRKETARIRIKFDCYEISVGTYQRIKVLKTIKNIMKNLLVTDPNKDRSALNVVLKMSGIDIFF